MKIPMRCDCGEIPDIGRSDCIFYVQCPGCRMESYAFPDPDTAVSEWNLGRRYHTFPDSPTVESWADALEGIIEDIRRVQDTVRGIDFNDDQETVQKASEHADILMMNVILTMMNLNDSWKGKGAEDERQRIRSGYSPLPQGHRGRSWGAGTRG